MLYHYIAAVVSSFLRVSKGKSTNLVQNFQGNIITPAFTELLVGKKQLLAL